MTNKTLTKEEELEIKQTIFKIWELEEEWNKIYEPGYNSVGLMTFNRVNDRDLFRGVEITEKIKLLKKDLKRMIGTWEYIKYSFNDLKYVQRITRRTS